MARERRPRPPSDPPEPGLHSEGTDHAKPPRAAPSGARTPPHQGSPHCAFRVAHLALSIRGQDRSTNQDFCHCVPELGLFIVADGMGGHAAGDIASRTATEAVEAALQEPERRARRQAFIRHPGPDQRRSVLDDLAEATRIANEAVIAAAGDDPERKGMGTTLDVLLLLGERAFIAHVGDARVYLVRPRTTVQLTDDHTSSARFQTSGKRTPTPLARAPLNNAVGHHRRRRLRVDTLAPKVAPGERIALCTDGFAASYDDDGELGQALRSGASRDALAARVRRDGPRDDATAVVVTIGALASPRGLGDEETARLDVEALAQNPLFGALSPARRRAALAAAVEVEIPADASVPPIAGHDRVAYAILEGVAELPDGRRLGPSALLLAESLVDVDRRRPPARAAERLRLLRVRRVDFEAVCDADAELAAELYRRLAYHLAAVHA
ncbi:MAG: protein phosphatase 2C domain-containing protein [Myxococcota bacterium]